jgi:hypothetical protein
MKLTLPKAFVSSLALIILATWLRVTHLTTHQVFFFDAAHDVLVAQENVPLLGIESSIPRFRQGPVTIWWQMLWLGISGNSLFVLGLSFALLQVVAIIWWRELILTQSGRKTADLTTLLIATSPFAIAQARMPYHTSPIPFALTAYLASLLKLKNTTPNDLFWQNLAWAFLFQFELTNAPLFLLIPFVWWQRLDRKRFPNLSEVSFATAGLTVGLLPQILYDLQHNFAQIGVFIGWVGYRIAAFLWPSSSHSFGLQRLIDTASVSERYVTRIFSFEWSWFTVLPLLVIFLGLWQWWKARHTKSATSLTSLSFFSVGLLSLAYIVHGSPSEAYFPPFMFLLPFLVSQVVMQLKPKVLQVLGILLFAGVAYSNVVLVAANNWFVSSFHDFSYGPSIAEQRQVIAYISSQTPTAHFNTTDPSGKFANYFDAYRFWANKVSLSVSTDGTIFFIESKDSPLNSYPNMKKIPFTTIDLYEPNAQ